jgi:hypothetical protein
MDKLHVPPTPEPLPEAVQAWAVRARAAGWGETAAAVLDMLAPLGVLAAQGVWMAAPLARTWLPGTPWDALAAALERPHGTAAVRRALLGQAAPVREDDASAHKDTPPWDLPTRP